jgi:hypothetical protein
VGEMMYIHGPGGLIVELWVWCAATAVAQATFEPLLGWLR